MSFYVLLSSSLILTVLGLACELSLRWDWPARWPRDSRSRCSPPFAPDASVIDSKLPGNVLHGPQEENRSVLFK